MWPWDVLVVIILPLNVEALLLVEENRNEGLNNKALSLTQLMFQEPLYCACIISDGSTMASDTMGRVIASSSIPVSGGLCPGTALGMLIAQNGMVAISNVIKPTQHFQHLLVLVSDFLDIVLANPSNFKNMSLHVVAANSSSVFRLILPEYQTFQEVTPDGITSHRSLPDLQGQTLYVATFHCPPFSYRNSWGNLNGIIPKGVPDGVEMAVFRAISKRLNFKWKLQEIQGADTWGHLNANGSWSGGIMGAMSRNLADIAFCGIFIEEEAIEVMDLTIPWTHYCLTFLVPRHASSFRFAILRTFQPTLWFAITAATLGTTVVYWQLSHSRQKSYTMTEALLSVVGMLSLSCFPKQESCYGTLCPLVASWCVFSLLLTTALSSGLVSHLTRPAAAPQLNSVRDLVESGITWGQPYKQEHPHIFNPQNPWHAQFAERFELELNLFERVSRVRNGHYAILGGKLDGIAPYFMEGDTLKNTGLLPRLHVMNECLVRQYAALGLKKGSSLTQPVSRMLRWLLETGLVEHWQADLVRDHGNPEIKMLFHTPSQSGPQQLSLTHLGDIFIMLSIGLLAATIVFVIELSYYQIKGRLN